MAMAMGRACGGGLTLLLPKVMLSLMIPVLWDLAIVAALLILGVRNPFHHR